MSTDITVGLILANFEVARSGEAQDLVERLRGDRLIHRLDGYDVGKEELLVRRSVRLGKGEESHRLFALIRLLFFGLTGCIFVCPLSSASASDDEGKSYRPSQTRPTQA